MSTTHWSDLNLSYWGKHLRNVFLFGNTLQAKRSPVRTAGHEWGLILSHNTALEE